MSDDPVQPGAVAVIALQGRFPGARDTEQFWRNLAEGREAVCDFSTEDYLAAGGDPGRLDDPGLVLRESVLDDIDLFDAHFFGYGPNEARMMDPQHRLFLECCHHVLEQAGYPAENHDGDIGVYAGAGPSRYLLFNLWDRLRLGDDPAALFSGLIGNSGSSLVTRVAYQLGLTGPAIAVQTACSTSLVAVHLACQDLLEYRCDLALAGGVSLNPLRRQGYRHVPDGPFSASGHCRPFDEHADGTVPGDGVGAVLLKRLDDALADRDRIRAVIIGSAINNDGRRKVGFTAPSVVGQAEVIVAAQTVAGVSPDSISYVEAHGTGTPMGDPIEFQALTTAFSGALPGSPPGTASRPQHCALGSVKANIGHTDAAAGIAGLIKTVLALEHRMIPPAANYRRPNSLLALPESPFHVPTALTAWSVPGHPLRAGVSSFGIGGTNAHLIVQQPPPERPVCGGGQLPVILPLSAARPQTVATVATQLAGHLERDPAANLPDVAYTLQVGRRALAHRSAVVASTPDEATTALRTVGVPVAGAVSRRLVFAFPGTGAEYAGMGAGLYETEPVFRAEIDRCAAILAPVLPRDLRDLLYHRTAQDHEQCRRHAVVAPLLVATEHALCAVLLSHGLHPSALVGHSLGEYAAACAAGVMSLEQMLLLVTERGRLADRVPGAMVSVRLDEHATRGYLCAGLSLAGVNTGTWCVVSGTVQRIEDLQVRLAGDGVEHQRLNVTFPGHCAELEPVLPEYADALRSVTLRPPTMAMISNVTGAWLTSQQAVDPEYWVRQTRAPVRFAAGLDTVATDTDLLMVEVGPGRSVGRIAREHLGSRSVVVPLMRHPRADVSDARCLAEGLARLWCHGAALDWRPVHGPLPRRRLALPGYPFDRRRYWMDPVRRPVPDVAALVATDVADLPEDPMADPAWSASCGQRPPLSVEYVAPRTAQEWEISAMWCEVLGFDRVGVHDNFFELGGDSLLAMQLLTRLARATSRRLSLDQLYHHPTVAELVPLCTELFRQREHDRRALRIRPAE